MNQPDVIKCFAILLCIWKPFGFIVGPESTIVVEGVWFSTVTVGKCFIITFVYVQCLSCYK